MRLSPHCAFQYSDEHSYVFLSVSRWIRFYSPRAHQSEHSTTRCMESSTVLENMAPLLFPSFAFSGASISSLLKLLSLADLHHVLAITARPSATGYQPLPLSVVTTLTQVPFVSIDRRGSPMSLSARPIRYIVSGLPTPNSATAGRRPLTPRTTTQVRPL